MTAAALVCLEPEIGSHGAVTSPLRYSMAFLMSNTQDTVSHPVSACTASRYLVMLCFSAVWRCFSAVLAYMIVFPAHGLSLLTFMVNFFSR